MKSIFTWENIHKTPKGNGIYAWYYRHELTDYDIETLVLAVREASKEGRIHDAREAITSFIRRYVIEPLRMNEYRVVLRGQLKPTYEGAAEHVLQVSGNLVERYVEDPSRVWALKEALETAAPLFAAPLYMGMAKRLNVRLARHKALIESYFDSGITQQPTNPMEKRLHDEDQAFALEVARRKLVPSRLLVAAEEVTKPIEVDVENLLNRVVYPVFGRN